MSVKFTSKNVRIQIDCREAEIVQGDPFTSIFFDEKVHLRQMGKLLPSILGTFEQKGHVKIEFITSVVSDGKQGTLLLLRHTSPQQGRERLM